ncbi:MAG: hypothetical protein EOP04_03235 [Proteobacteria bacterium]|nr:MAG: hypothetical protein EOP04_03235 [Pseudomonadota bacterium]
MKIQLAELRIPDLDNQSAAALTELLGNDVQIVEPKEQKLEGREFVTLTAVVVVSLAALRVLAIWIARQTEFDETEISIQTQRKDGTYKTVNFRSRHGSAKTNADVLKELADACHIDISDILGDPGEGE